jgi:hypothetical protein
MVYLLDKSLVGICRDDKIVDFVEASNAMIAQEVQTCKFTDVITSLGLCIHDFFQIPIKLNYLVGNMRICALFAILSKNTLVY